MMTGKELIIYILENKLENEEVFKNGGFLDFLTEEEAAANFNVGVETMKTWRLFGMVKGIQFGYSVLYPKNLKDPRKDE